MKTTLEFQNREHGREFAMVAHVPQDGTDRTRKVTHLFAAEDDAEKIAGSLETMAQSIRLLASLKAHARTN